MKTIVLNRFDGGMVNDVRSSRQNVCATCQHFDALTNAHRLTPYRSSEVGDSSAATNSIANFAYYKGNLYGLAQASGTGPTAVLTNSGFTGAVWSTANGSSNIGGSNRATADLPVFVAYHNKLYGVRGAQYVWSIPYTGSTANTSECDLIAYTTVAPGLVHSKDDILYIPYDNKIAKNNAGSWVAAALTLPSALVITSICEYGNYLAIGCRSQDGLRSKAFLWDRDSTLTTLSESIDWGEGDLTILEELEGVLFGVSFLGTTGTYVTSQAKMIVRYYDAARGAVKLQEFVGFSQSPAIQGSWAKQKFNNRIFFSAAAPKGSTSYTGLWSIGRSATDRPFSVNLDRFLDNGTAHSSISLTGFYYLGDFVFTSFFDQASVWQMYKTDDTATYTATSIYETVINPEMPAVDRTAFKQLLALKVAYAPLPAAGQVVAKYRVDGGSWTTVFTETTDSKIVTRMTLDASGTQFTSGREYEFRIESTGGAEITEIAYEYEVQPEPAT